MSETDEIIPLPNTSGPSYLGDRIAEERQLRIEALRAAAVVSAGIASGAVSGGTLNTLGLAEQFRTWLEDKS